jgi:3-hydroxyisobutyrate dehydrogenase-like beta-hydroxyacid dehydrogenase
MPTNGLAGTIGILFPGEMGGSFGRRLRESSFTVVTTTRGRSPRTQKLCREAGLAVLASIDDVIKNSDIVISLVPPGAAETVANDVASIVKRMSRRIIYVDANSISPATLERIAEIFRGVPVDFIDAAIFGLAAQISERGTLYLSGPRAAELGNLFAGVLRVKVVGDSLGLASSLKMIISGIPKGLSALFMETMLLARKMNLLDESLKSCAEIYPSIMEIAARMLPSYPLHSSRRSEESAEVAKTMLMNGITPRITEAVHDLTSELAEIHWADREAVRWTVSEVIEALYQHEASNTRSQTNIPVAS